MTGGEPALTGRPHDVSNTPMKSIAKRTGNVWAACQCPPSRHYGRGPCPCHGGSDCRTARPARQRDACQPRTPTCYADLTVRRSGGCRDECDWSPSARCAADEKDAATGGFGARGCGAELQAAGGWDGRMDGPARTRPGRWPGSAPTAPPLTFRTCSKREKKKHVMTSPVRCDVTVLGSLCPPRQTVQGAGRGRCDWPPFGRACVLKPTDRCCA